MHAGKWGVGGGQRRVTATHTHTCRGAQRRAASPSTPPSILHPLHAPTALLWPARDLPARPSPRAAYTAHAQRLHALPPAGAALWWWGWGGPSSSRGFPAAAGGRWVVRGLGADPQRQPGGWRRSVSLRARARSPAAQTCCMPLQALRPAALHPSHHHPPLSPARVVGGGGARGRGPLPPTPLAKDLDLPPLPRSSPFPRKP